MSDPFDRWVTPASAPLPRQPAQSPLTERDQRLHEPELSAALPMSEVWSGPALEAEGADDAPHLSSRAPPEPASPVFERPAPLDVAPPNPPDFVVETTSRVETHVVDGGRPSANAVEAPPPISVSPVHRTRHEPTARVSTADAPPPPADGFAEVRPKAPMTLERQVLETFEQVERWLKAPAPEEVSPREREATVPSHPFEAPLGAAPLPPPAQGGVDMRSPDVPESPPPPRVHIGHLTVEVLPPEPKAAPKPPSKRAVEPVAAPSRPTLPSPSPRRAFGWRQRG